MLSGFEISVQVKEKLKFEKENKNERIFRGLYIYVPFIEAKNEMLGVIMLIEKFPI